MDQKGSDGGFKVGQLILSAGIRLFALAGLPVDGTSGTGVLNKAATGSRYYDRTNKVWYINVGTAASPVWVSESMTAVVTITAAEVKALRATPKELVPAPGAGRVLEFISIALLLDYGGTNGFTETTDNLAVRYENGTGAIASQAIETTGFIDQTADTFTLGLAKNDVIVAKSGCENKALVLHNTGDGEIAGNAANNNVVRARVSYAVHATGW